MDFRTSKRRLDGTEGYATFGAPHLRMSERRLDGYVTLGAPLLISRMKDSRVKWTNGEYNTEGTSLIQPSSVKIIDFTCNTRPSRWLQTIGLYSSISVESHHLS